MQNNLQSYVGIVRKFEDNKADRFVHLPHHEQSNANQGGSRVMSESGVKYWRTWKPIGAD